MVDVNDAVHSPTSPSRSKTISFPKFRSKSLKTSAANELDPKNIEEDENDSSRDGSINIEDNSNSADNEPRPAEDIEKNHKKVEENEETKEESPKENITTKKEEPGKEKEPNKEKEPKSEEEKEEEPEKKDAQQEGEEEEEEDDEEVPADSVFFLPENSKYIVYQGKDHPYQIQTASIHKLIEKVTTPEKQFHKEYTEFMSVFFMTYRSFTTAETVLQLLVRRFKGPEGELTEKQQKKLDMKVVREGVCKSFVHWFNNHYRDFSGKPLAKELEKFIDWAMKDQPPKKDNFTGYLEKMYQKKSGKGTYTSLFDSGIMVDKNSCPEPIVPKSWTGITLLDLDELEIARQLSISEHHIYAEIQPVELQELAWSKYKDLAPRLLDMIAQFNTFSNAVSSLIVTCPKLKLRKKMVEKFVRIAENLLEMNSFNMVMAIFSGFQNAATHRLSHTFGNVSKKTQESIERINELLSSKNSYKAYRDMLNNVNPPCIPFLGVYLSDLTFVDEGNPKIVNGLVNYRKKQLEYGVIIQVLRFQDRAYQFKLLPKFAQLFRKLPQMNDSELYAASLKVEPRKAKKKDIK